MVETENKTEAVNDVTDVREKRKSRIKSLINSISTKSFWLSKKGVLVILIIVAVGSSVSYAIYASNNQDVAVVGENTQSANTNTVSKKVEMSDPISIIQNYASIKDVVKFGNYSWAAVDSGVVRYDDSTAKFYDQSDGLDGPRSSKFEILDNVLWVATANGVSRYDQELDIFKPYFKDEQNDAFSGGIGNVNMFINPINNKLQVSSFKNFNEYDKVSDSFKSVVGPINGRQIEFNETIGVANVWEGAGYNVIFEYSAELGWHKTTELKQYADQSVYLEEIDGRFVLFGRSSEFKGCASLGKEQAVLFNEYKDGGTLSLINELNTNFFAKGLSPKYDRSSMQVGTSVCTTQEGFKGYNFEIVNDNITLTEVPGAVDSISAEPQKFVEEINKIKSIVKRDPIHKVIGVESDGSLITSSSSGFPEKSHLGRGRSGTASDSFGYTLALNQLNLVERNTFSNPTNLGVFKDTTQDTAMRAVVCDGALKYVVRGVVTDFEGGSSGLEKVYRLENDALVEDADVAGKIKTSGEISEVICLSDKLVWISGRKLISYDRSEKILSVVSEYGESYEIIPSGGLFWATAEKRTGGVGYIDPKDGKYTELKLQGISKDDGIGLRIVAVSSTQLWASISSGDSREIVAFDFKGNQLYRTKVDNAANGITGTVFSDDQIVIIPNGSWGVLRDIIKLNSTEKSTTVLDIEIPVRENTQSMVYNNITKDVWVNAGPITFSFKNN